MDKHAVAKIAEAVEVLGGQPALAKVVGGVHPSLVSQWVTGRLQVAARHCIAVETATNGRVTRYDLRPDVFGQPEARPGRGAQQSQSKYG